MRDCRTKGSRHAYLCITRQILQIDPASGCKTRRCWLSLHTSHPDCLIRCSKHSDDSHETWRSRNDPERLTLDTLQLRIQDLQISENCPCKDANQLCTCSNRVLISDWFQQFLVIVRETSYNERGPLTWTNKRKTLHSTGEELVHKEMLEEKGEPQLGTAMRQERRVGRKQGLQQDSSSNDLETRGGNEERRNCNEQSIKGGSRRSRSSYVGPATPRKASWSEARRSRMNNLTLLMDWVRHSVRKSQSEAIQNSEDSHFYSYSQLISIRAVTVCRTKFIPSIPQNTITQPFLYRHTVRTTKLLGL